MSNSTLVSALSLDPALNHGCFLEAVWDFSNKEQPVLVEYNLLLSWLQDGGVKSPIRELQGLALEIIRKIPSTNKRRPGFVEKVAIDWDPTSIFWNNTSRLQAVKVAYLMGLLTHGFLTQHIAPIFITPSVVRRLTNNPTTQSKERVLGKFRESIKIQAPPGDVYQDIQDALLLNLLVLGPERDSFAFLFQE